MSTVLYMRWVGKGNKVYCAVHALGREREKVYCAVHAIGRERGKRSTVLYVH